MFSPPRVAERLLQWCLRRAPSTIYIVGDLRQEYAALRGERGVVIAGLWYWREVATIGVRYAGRRLEHVRARGPGHWAFGPRPSPWGDLAGALREGLRIFRTSPGAAATIVLTLALGIGANAAMFGAVDRVLLSPPEHVQDHESLRFLYLGGLGARTRNNPMAYSFPDYVSITGLPVLAGTAAYQPRTALTMGTGPLARRVIIQNATAEFFPLLGVRPSAGRFFNPGDDRPGAPPVAVLSDGFWAREFGRDETVIGRNVTLGLHDYEVIGIAPRRFTGANLEAVDVWLPLRMNVLLTSSWNPLESRGAMWFRVVVRLEPGVSDADAESLLTDAHLAGIQAAVEAGVDLDEEERGGRVHVGSIMTALGPNADGDTANTLWLMGVSLLVLLIASANVANLMLARGIDRQRERAIRLALGLSRWRLLLQALAEALALAFAGGVAAVVVAGWSARALYGLLLPGIPLPDAAVSLRLIGFLGVVVLATAVAAGLLPALQALRTTPGQALRRGSRGSTRGGGRARSLLTVGQVALSSVLLVAAGLFVQSLQNALATDFGFDHASLLNVGFEGQAGVDDDRRDALYREAAEALRALPDVERVAVSSSNRTLYGWDEMRDLFASRVDSVGRAPQGGPYWYAGTEGYVETAGFRVVQGRAFVPDEYATGGPPALMVSRSFAEGVWPGLDPIGECVRLREGTLMVDGPEPCRPVVGVYQDVKTSITEPTSWSVTWPISMQDRGLRGILVRTTGDPLDLVEPIRDRVSSLSSEVRYVQVLPMSTRIDAMRGSWRVGATLFSIFGFLALAVASLGLYSVLSFAVARRSREIGIRSALGAGRRDLVAMVISRAGTLVGVGLMVGIGVALLLGRFLESVLFGVPAVNPGVFGIVVAAFVVAGLLASWVPARRVTAIDPTRAMAAE